jgi:hypothetical protein
MFDHKSIRALAKEIKVPAIDLLAMAEVNDPFYVDIPYRTAAAQWFVELRDRIDFGYRFHIRRAHYKIVSQPIPVVKPNGEAYENTDRDWGLLLQASRDARYLELIDNGAVIDNRNPGATINAEFAIANIPSIHVVGNELYEMSLPKQLDLPELILGGFKALQRYLVEIWTEKSGQNDVLLPLARRHGVNLINFDGECSETGCRDAIKRSIESGRPLRIIYLSDFDPAGRSMPVAAARKIEFWCRCHHPDLDVTVDPIALLPEQAARYGLPRTPIKTGERRAAKFEERFGLGATELDALEAVTPGELRKIVEAGILRHIDPDLPEREQTARQAINDELAEVEEEVHGRHSDAIAAVEEEYSQLRAQMSDLRERAGALWDQISEDLLAAAPYVTISDVPRPCVESDQLTPLFSSKRRYLEQLDWYRRWQGRAGAGGAP